MKRTRISPALSDFPAVFHPLLTKSEVYDSSCSREAHVYYIAGVQDCFLKCAPKGTLREEADMTAYFHKRGLAAEVLSYVSEEKDWLMTVRVPGEDCTHSMYLQDPNRLCDTLGETLRALHDLPACDCPARDKVQSYLAVISRNRADGQFSCDAFPEEWQFASADEAWRIVEVNAPFLKSDTLSHGDYCLPNLLLDSWRFSGFIDLGNSGMHDRHFDLFWGSWSLFFNLKTNRYRHRFWDAYGRDRIDMELLRAAAAVESFG